jgi:hypothetical protein
MKHTKPKRTISGEVLGHAVTVGRQTQSQISTVRGNGCVQGRLLSLMSCLCGQRVLQTDGVATFIRIFCVQSWGQRRTWPQQDSRVPIGTMSIVAKRQRHLQYGVR